MSTPKKLLITGSRGFVGGHLLNALRNLSPADIIAELPREIDITNASSLASFVSAVAPTHVIHLAGQTFVPRSFEDPGATFQANVIGTLNLLESLKGAGPNVRFLYVSSGDVYGPVPEQDLPANEQLTPTPVSPYGSSKIAAEQLCLQWNRSFGTECVIARPFNHIGPGQRPDFVVPALARQVVAISRGQADPVVSAGDIDTTRDFTDVRDIVDAYIKLLDAPDVAGQIYNIGSGVERTVRSLLEKMCELKEISPVITQDMTLFRRSEQRRMYADTTALFQRTGWSPKIDIDQTLLDIFRDLEENS